MKFSKAYIIAALAATANGFELLKNYSHGFRIGAATNTIHYNNRNYVEAMKAFNYMVAENACKFVSIQGTKGRFNFNDCDNHLKKAKELGMAFRGHALIWHSMAPKWLENENGNTMRQSIINHITTVLKHYEGQIDTWDVVNEALDDSSNGNGWKMRPSFLYRNVPDFIDLAFKTARQVSPKTKLFYNDYSTEGIWGKSESCYQFVADLKKRNIPIDGVGLQYHVSVQNQPQFNKIDNLISRYCKLGVEVHITEMDVSCENNCGAGDIENRQGQVFSNALKACLKNSCCTGFLVWGIGDPDSWLGSGKKGLLFNGNYQPKAQYTSLLNVLKTTTAASLGNGGGNGDYTPEPIQEVDITKDAAKFNDGWYTFKNPNSGMYLAAAAAGNSENVVISATPQAWKITNLKDKYITLTSSLGNYVLDVTGGEDKDGANIQIYSPEDGNDNQKFAILKTSNGQYVIAPKISSGYRVIDIENRGSTEGSNILIWENAEKTNQVWVIEAASNPNGQQQPQPSECWSTGLGYPCCKTCSAVYFTDSDGSWSIENGDWCGLSKDCNKGSTCTGAQGYPCCKSSCDVYSEDADGKWSVENNDWCLIDNSKC